MKATITIVCLLICGCAYGSPSPDPSMFLLPSTPEQTLAPEDNYDAGKARHCWIVATSYASNCSMDEIVCDDGMMRLDSRCFPTAWVPKWKDLPDPPPPFKN